MTETILAAQERIENLKLLRKTGYVPGVLYGDGYENGVPVKFVESSLNKLINNHGSNAKVWIEYNGKKNFGYIKALQRNILSGKIVHSDIHILSQNDKIRIKLPIVFDNISDLQDKRLMLQILTSKIDATGKAGLMPEYISFNVGNLRLGDAIKAEDLELSDNIKVNNPDEVYAMVVEIRGSDSEVKESA